MSVLKAFNKEGKFQTIISSYLNGNKFWVKTHVKKMNRLTRKELYNYYMDNYETRTDDAYFFFNLI